MEHAEDALEEDGDMDAAPKTVDIESEAEADEDEEEWGDDSEADDEEVDEAVSSHIGKKTITGKRCSCCACRSEDLLFVWPRMFPRVCIQRALLSSQCSWLKRSLSAGVQ